jgi:hypothetical protein
VAVTVPTFGGTVSKATDLILVRKNEKIVAANAHVFVALSAFELRPRIVANHVDARGVFTFHCSV